MKEQFEVGRIANYFLYYIACILIAIGGLIAQNTPLTVHLFICVYLLLSCIFLKYLQLSSKFDESICKKALVILCLLLASILCFEFENPHLLFYLLFIQCFSFFLFQDEKIATFQTEAMFVYLFLLGSLQYSEKPRITWLLGSPQELSIREFAAATVALLIVQWMMHSQIQFNILKNRQNKEQERSLDDLLRVVEAKCDEARMATKSKSDFLSNMSHEIRTPINAVLGLNEIILRESREENIKEYAVNIESSGKMLLSLINDILDFSKIESGKMEIVPVEYQVSSILNDLINMIQPKVNEKGLKLQVEVNEKIPNGLLGDEVRIRQIVINLLSNAVKYTDVGTITLQVDFRPKTEKEIQLCFTVRDTGRGIKREDQKKLFQSFQRVDQKNNRNIEGTGLGLAITKSFVNMMNGKLSLESEYGKGSVFCAELPQKIVRNEEIGDFKKQIEKSIRARENYKESFHAPNAKILVVDDNDMNLKVVKGLLKQTKVQIDTAKSGMEGIQKLRENQYHVVMLDHMMPKMDGVETLQQIKKEGLAKDIPIIALTANAVSGAREMYLDYGFQDYLVKPIAGKNLEKMLRHWLPERLITKISEDTLKEEAVSQKDVLSGTSSTGTDEVDYSGDVAEDIARLNRQLALTYCADSEEMYLEILKSYYEQYEGNGASLQEYVQQEDWEDYKILAHTMKSTSLTIGAKNFSEEAGRHEYAIKNAQLDIPKTEWKKLLSDYRLVVEQVKEILEQNHMLP
ncbi:MAG: ATP-binding protein [Lachnospiraceae bacterium]|nr:ATP-binding protein [Lachnospiraceae bacterium]